MTIIEIGQATGSELTLRQRWSHYLVILYGITMVFLGINLRDSVLYATIPYEDVRVGIRAFYPQYWLLDTEGDYVFRVQDMTQTTYKTTIQVSIAPISTSSSSRTLLDNLSLSRFQLLAGYRQFPRRQITLQDEIEATVMEYTYVQSETDPFLESVPIVVQGIDLIVIQRGQAVIVTFQADADRYEQLYPTFETFLADLEF
jgi:hypothetical protein